MNKKEDKDMAIISINGYAIARQRVTKEDIKRYEAEGFTVTIL